MFAHDDCGGLCFAFDYGVEFVEEFWVVEIEYDVAAVVGVPDGYGVFDDVSEYDCAFVVECDGVGVAVGGCFLDVGVFF